MKDTTAPIWRETLFLYVRDSGSQSLTVHLEHADRSSGVAQNIMLGRAKVANLKALCDGKVHDLHLDLEGCALAFL